eukprot:TRINITY_DN74781_c0_g1_i1.p1 TRINITY_DN74781_c0_g1~~TRINITY_DN74781_c0_g1_i1.p1  ORF type:complete len:934 (-),score=226.17 TRINITY_DN74781_c0_g1_i1:110-2860(-)
MADSMAEEPDAKRQRIEAGAATADDAEMTKKDGVEELEGDAKPIVGQPLRGKVAFELPDCTPNVIPSLGSRLLMPLTEGGMQYLLAGARANVGVSQGRYFYEVKVVELLSPSEGHMRSQRAPMPRNIVRVGFSTKGSSLFLADTEDGVCFEADGYFTIGKKREPVCERFTRENTLAVLLNLDPSSPNANTVSLFKDGRRASAPQALPASLRGKALFPHVCFKNVTMQVNFSAASVPLPFKCHSWQHVPPADGEVGTEPPDDGKFEVIFPVCVPDEGTFDWLDGFLSRHPGFVELSDRAIWKWAEKSGIYLPKTSSWKHSHDKPDLQAGIPLVDDWSIRRILQAIVATQPRNYVVMEVKSNLVKQEREQLLKRFKRSCYRTIAEVVMGEPDADFKTKVHQALLEEKQQKADEEWSRRKAEKERDRQINVRRLEEEQTKRAAAEEEAARRKAAEQETEAVKKAEEAASREQTEKEGDGDGTSQDKLKKAEKEEEVKQESKNEEVKKEEQNDVDMKVEVKEETDAAETYSGEAMREEEPDEPRPVAFLTDEEKNAFFKKRAVSDLTSWVMSEHVSKFSIPEQSDGFDLMRFPWASEESSRKYFHSWILKQKLICRIENIVPGEWFSQKFGELQKALAGWSSRQKECEQSRATPRQEAADGKEGEDAVGTPAEKKPTQEVTDVFAVEDVCNTSSGSPLFAEFSWEDWALLTLRAELHLMLHSFKKDASDPERAGIHEQNLVFYYSKYFKKSFSVKNYGVDDNNGLVALVKDTLTIAENQVLQPLLGEELESFDIFVKMTEECRRDRIKRLDSGDEAARLHFTRPDTSPPPPPPEQHWKGGGFKGGGFKGDDRGFKGGFKGERFKGGFKGDDKGFKGGCHKGGFPGGHKGFDKGFSAGKCFGGFNGGFNKGGFMGKGCYGK